jgi:hypothetical protein
MAFIDAFQKLMRRARREELNILVWGPGNATDSPEYRKRVKIRDELRSHFRSADVQFSEDLEGTLADVLPAAGKALSLRAKEAWHLAACHICVVLDVSPGAQAEIAYFTDSAWDGRLMVLAPEKYKGSASFPADLRKNKNIVFYGKGEFDTCDLVKRVIERTQNIALWELGGGFKPPPQ